MTTFKEAFEFAIEQIIPMVQEYEYALVNKSVSGDENSQFIGGSARFEKKKAVKNIFNSKQYFDISVAPLRLELDLDIGIRKDFYTIYELYELEEKGAFPERKHNLYDSAHNPEMLADEFKSLVKCLIQNGRRFFGNDASLWEELQNQREQRELREEHENLFKEAEIAFKEKVWDKVIMLLDKNELTLSKSNVLRLKYAKSQLNKCT